MCGICGCIDRTAPDAAELRDRAVHMARTISHRGPDDHGVWSDASAGVALAHRRLSILDLSPRGAQPMESRSGRFTVVFNGEIYNFRQLREELAAAGATFRGDSDTEVVLAAFERWGVEAALARLNGMFAIAAWDTATRTLTLSRDRIGEKPLYYGWAGATFLFGSELKSLAAHPAFNRTTDPAALSLYLRHGYVPAPHTIYADIRKLPAGTFLTIEPGAPPRSAVPVAYWDLATAAHSAAAAYRARSDSENVDALEALLADAVGIRMVADVPLGAFLSGGIDSSLVVALMQQASSRPVRTFSIGFAEREHDEAPFARAIAAHLSTDHTELRVSPDDALALVPRLPEIYDEPFGDSSAIPTTLLSLLTRRHVTVALSGDGGDELFGGYTRYARAERAWRLRGRVPPAVRTVTSASLRALSRVGGPHHRDRLARFAQLVSSRHPMEQYSAMTGYWDPRILLPGVVPHETVATTPGAWQDFADATQSLMYADAKMYLPDDILVKVDRASMSASLEARVPLLDHRVVEHAWGLPRDLRLRDGRRKWILREILARHVPPALFERPKAGFGVPLPGWLRGPLREWGETLLSHDRLRDSGLAPSPVRRLWTDHMNGADHADRLWIVLMYQAWHEAHSGPGAAA